MTAYSQDDTDAPWAGSLDPLPVGIEAPVAIQYRSQKKHWDWETIDYPHTCPVCGKAFVGRRNRLYCSSACQKKAYKLRCRGLLQPVYSLKTIPCL